jgi:hypothetical protein
MPAEHASNQLSQVKFQKFVDGSGLPQAEKLHERIPCPPSNTTTKMVILQSLRLFKFPPRAGMELLPIR